MIGGPREPQGSRGPGGVGNLGNLRQILVENNKIICIIGIGIIIGADTQVSLKRLKSLKLWHSFCASYK